jgi:hypothetical protein
MPITAFSFMKRGNDVKGEKNQIRQEKLIEKINM